MSFERLTAQDVFFYELEDADTPLHIGALAFFSKLVPGSTVPIEDVRRAIVARLPLLPRYRMRVVETPWSGRPAWVDDVHFDITHHVRLASLPRPGGAREFDEVVGEFLSERLDRGRPLWQVRVIDGLEGDRAAALFKAHHCLTDGTSAVDMLLLLLAPQPAATVPEPPAWTPRPEPSAFDLLRGELDARAALGRSVRDFALGAARDPRSAVGFVTDRTRGIREAAGSALTWGSATTLNGALGPDRHLRTLRIELDDVKAIRRAFGGTVNDVVVALVTGALARFLAARGERLGDMTVRASIPVSTRTDVEHGTLGNKLALLPATLPIEIRDPVRRFQAVRRTLDGLKGSKLAFGMEVANWLAEWTTPSLLTAGSRFSLRLHATHLMITNIRGPADPLYCLAYPMLEAYPAPPLSPGQTLSIGVLSYADFLHWGLVCDPRRLTDLDALVDALRTEIAELRKLAAES